MNHFFWNQLDIHFPEEAKVDHENYDINEPWDSYRAFPVGNPTWQNLKFDLEKDMTGINIDM